MITTNPYPEWVSGRHDGSGCLDRVRVARMKVAPPMSHPKERLAYQAGEKLFYYRAGPYDFGCVTCHGEEGSGSGCRICRK